MSELVFLSGGKNNTEPFTTSKVISEATGIGHKKLKAAISKHRVALETFGLLVSYGAESTGGRPEEIYRLNEQQATLLITFLKNTPIVVAFKTELVRQFYEMRRLLMEKQTADWQQTRLQSKQVRLKETDAIKELVEYAKAQGSQNSNKLYIVYSKLVKQLAEYESRDMSDVNTLTEILTFERLLFGIITSEMMVNTPYKEIYQKAKAQLLEIKRLWAMPQLTA